MDVGPPKMEQKIDENSSWSEAEIQDTFLVEKCLKMEPESLQNGAQNGAKWSYKNRREAPVLSRKWGFGLISVKTGAKRRCLAENEVLGRFCKNSIESL